MNRRLRLLWLAPWLAAACASPPAPPSLRPEQAIAVLPRTIGVGIRCSLQERRSSTATCSTPTE